MIKILLNKIKNNSGNLFVKISYHLPSFVIIKDIAKQQTNKENIQNKGYEKLQSRRVP